MSPQHNWGAPEWARYVLEAHAATVDAIIETGRRMKEVHAAYNSAPRKWGRRWDQWCADELMRSRECDHPMPATSHRNRC